MLVMRRQKYLNLLEHQLKFADNFIRERNWKKSQTSAVITGKSTGVFFYINPYTKGCLYSRTLQLHFSTEQLFIPVFSISIEFVV